MKINKNKHVTKQGVVKSNPIKSVQVPLNEQSLTDSVATIFCPYCGCDRTVELDAYYIVECECCKKKYRVIGCI